MATPSDTPPSSTDEKIPNPVSLAIQPTVDDRQDTKVEAIRESPPPSVFVNSEPIREDQVQNALKFLSHPKVRGSPVIYRRSFLERKGLTKEEIDEAFRRVPDPPPAVTTTQPAVTNQDGQINSSSNVQQKDPTQIMQPTQIVPVGSISKTGTLSQFHWSHALLGVGFLAVSGAGTVVLFKKAIIPRLKSWIRKVVLEEEEGLPKKNDVKPSVAEEAAAAAKAAAAAAADVARASQEMMISKDKEKRCFEELINMLNIQVQEMKSMSSAIQKLEGQSSINGRIAVEEQDDRRVQTSSKQPYANGKADADSHSVRSLSPPATVQPSVAPHPKSYMEILDMIQRGEKPSNIREINDAPPNPNQPLSNPRLAPKPKPWEVSQSQNSSTNFLQTQEGSNGSSHEFLDKQSNGDDALPWWQQKHVTITEIEAGDEQKFGSFNVLDNERTVQRSWVPPQPLPVVMPEAAAPIRFGSFNVLDNERPVQRSWVPPQPPPVVMPEAAAAIRQPKKSSFQKEELTDDQLLARSPDVTDDMQSITKISESGNVLEANGGTSSENFSEIKGETS